MGSMNVTGYLYPQKTEAADSQANKTAQDAASTSVLRNGSKAAAIVLTGGTATVANFAIGNYFGAAAAAQNVAYAILALTAAGVAAQAKPAIDIADPVVNPVAKGLESIVTTVMGGVEYLGNATGTTWLVSTAASKAWDIGKAAYDSMPAMPGFAKKA